MSDKKEGTIPIMPAFNNTVLEIPEKDEIISIIFTNKAGERIKFHITSSWANNVMDDFYKSTLGM